MSNRKSFPKSALSRVDKKTVRNAPIQKQNIPSWRFSKIDKSGPFKWPCSTETELQILQKLKQFDSMLWTDILGNDHHAIPLNRLSKTAQNRLATLTLDDVDEIYSFHFSGKQRIIGIRDLDVVRLLWWDPEHEVCPSKKKHT
jgi:hypothetical protein